MLRSSKDLCVSSNLFKAISSFRDLPCLIDGDGGELTHQLVLMAVCIAFVFRLLARSRRSFHIQNPNLIGSKAYKGPEIIRNSEDIYTLSPIHFFQQARVRSCLPKLPSNARLTPDCSFLRRQCLHCELCHRAR